MTAPAGRPRSAAVDEAIADATIEEYAERGFAGMSVDGVAARAGVSKATIYRRHPSKLDLVQAALHSLADRRELPDTGRARDDLRLLLADLHASVVDPRRGGAMRQMVADGHTHHELAAVHAAFVRRRRQDYELVLERGVARGELRAGLDPEIVIDLLTGPVFLRHLTTRMPITPAYLDGMLDTVLQGATP